MQFHHNPLPHTLQEVGQLVGKRKYYSLLLRGQVCRDAVGSAVREMARQHGARFVRVAFGLGLGLPQL